ncbi:cysteine--tRNA ligase [Arsenicitalea aurantiaca]|uniref:Cysteine--tRNA ligase n=1 Tax=Arsenicitalea aurantiaca TaxID=1783274 RepID=A0A433XA03_9HYPH|nr:cysteine--tRNA ligase [Arsenicitalea aurantiaca]RUT30935.1 cysteine--tRNA ligase [Arsenicitalea aurantiaca]
MASGTTPLRLYNTLTRTKDAFTPLDASNVRMYVCGPTVYDFAHIGNARPVIVFDLLFRLLRHLYGEAHVTYVRNITDVDDKINARAARDFPDLPLNEAIRRVTEATNAQFQADVKALECLEPSVQPRATEHIAEMIAMCGVLIEKGHAYAAEGHVLFSPGTMADYGRLSNRSLDDMLAGARVDVAPYKRDPMDFVLWKPSSPEEPGWESPWGRGRPGWHIECSAMSEKHLGPVFDIHGGGIDLAFPHHENELAQSRCAHGTRLMAQVWMHNGFLQVEGRKMSKSEGNFVTIHDLLETEHFGGRRWPGAVLRLAMLMTHYREPIDFSVARLEEAARKLEGWWRAAREGGEGRASGPDASVIEALSDDLGFHRAAVAIDVMARKANRGEGEAAHCLALTLRFLGLGEVGAEGAAEGGDAAIEARVAARLAALDARDFAAADAIRAELLAEGVQLMDFKDAETGERRTKWERKL